VRVLGKMESVESVESVERVVQILKEKKSVGEPVCAYFYDLNLLRRHLSEIMSKLPPNFRMFYAMKANSEQRMLQVMSEYVEGFEVASFGEVRKAREISASIPIIFGGPGKTDEEIKGANEHDVQLIHVESLHELQRIQFIASSMDKVISILLRVNLKGPLPSATLQMAGSLPNLE
jgi:diaminopimelate decarboxylase